MSARAVFFQQSFSTRRYVCVDPSSDRCFPEAENRVASERVPRSLPSAIVEYCRECLLPPLLYVIEHVAEGSDGAGVRSHILLVQQQQCSPTPTYPS